MSFMRRGMQSKEYDQRSLSESLRDLDQALKPGIRLTAREFDAMYTEPMWVGQIRVAPHAILLGRVQQVVGPETALTGVYGLVNWVWDGSRTGARVTKIDGLTVGTEYRFTFLIAEGGA